MLFNILLTVSDVLETKPINEHPSSWRNSIFSFLDSSHLSTFILAIALIVYGSFRALDRDKAKDSASYKLLFEPSANEQVSPSHVIETIHAIVLPLGASLSLMIMFFYFDSLQTVFIICTAILSIM
ncbi:unnamed protein product, partial [Rotaria magnacalcarata]